MAALGPEGGLVTTTFYASFMAAENGRRQVGLFKREEEGGAPTDFSFARSLEWRWDKSGTLWAWLLGQGDGDFEVQSEHDAESFIAAVGSLGFDVEPF
ncbi:hypothetical protein GCM10022256_26110 [Frondihabitans peucedani]|uniref:Uncharacterized protein n=1 Tax=Frondihabitans peucedani TaxID=598626 RepID=A0ABP8E4L7_9MICO